MTDTYTKAFSTLFTGWQKAYGPKPTEAQLATAIQFSPHRKVGPQTLALAMRLREGGMTAGQQAMACGAPQNNFSGDKLKSGYFKRDMSAGTNEAGHTVYRYVLTPKGEAYVAKRQAAEADEAKAGADKPVKGKVKAKAKKPATRKRKADKAGNEPEAVTEAIQGEAATTVAAPTENSTSEHGNATE